MGFNILRTEPGNLKKLNIGNSPEEVLQVTILYFSRREI